MADLVVVEHDTVVVVQEIGTQVVEVVSAGPQGIPGPGTWAGVSDKPTVIAAGATQAEARTAIGAVADNDARLADQRTPTGAAGGVLSGAYPNPGFAVDMATQAELEAVGALKVDKVAGKALSTEDYTTAEKTKLAGVAAGAQVNTVTSVAGKTGAVTLAKTDVGLTNVDNTSDANKPVSTATQAALNTKANLASPSFTGFVVAESSQESTGISALSGSNSGFESKALGSGGTAGAATIAFHRPAAHAVHFGIDTDNKLKVGGWSLGANAYAIYHENNKPTKADVGLGNVDNTSDASKPVSTATQTALNGKEPTIAAGTATQYWRGDKTWRDFFTDVRAATLTGLSTATNAVVDATDTILAAIGKLQAQVSAKFDKTGGMINAASATNPNQRGVTTIFANFGHGASGSSVAAVALGSAQGQMAGYSFWPTFTGTGDNGARRAADIWASFDGGPWATEKLSFGVGRGGEANDAALVTTEKLTITSAGEASAALFVNNTVFGYGLGSGGTVVQAMSKSTAVTLNKPSGQITMNGAALAAGASVIFCLNNSAATAYDTVVVNGHWEFVDPGNYRIEIARMGGPNQIYIRVTNITAGSLSEALVINFSVIKAAKL